MGLAILPTERGRIAPTPFGYQREVKMARTTSQWMMAAKSTAALMSTLSGGRWFAAEAASPPALRRPGRDLTHWPGSARCRQIPATLAGLANGKEDGMRYVWKPGWDSYRPSVASDPQETAPETALWRLRRIAGLFLQNLGRRVAGCPAGLLLSRSRRLPGGPAHRPSVPLQPRRRK